MSEDGRTVLVTGAGGFIGGRLVEVLHASGYARPRAAVRRWSTAARVGRLPVEIVQCDVTDLEQVRAAIRGVRAVVHCATGPGDVNATGVRHVLEAAEEARVERVVHLSTIDVYGDVGGTVREDAALSTPGREYGDSKVAAELACGAAIDRGVPVTILRPTIVYGPFSTHWTAAFGRRLQRRPWPFPAAASQGTCNLVYVDDLVGAIIAALEREEGVGRAFNINGAERPTWHEYFSALNDALELPPLDPVGERAATLRTAGLRPVRAMASFAARRARAPIRALARRSPAAQALVQSMERSIRSVPTDDQLRLFGKHASFPTDAAEEALGYRARFSMADGVELSAAWLRHHGYVQEHQRSGSVRGQGWTR